MTVQDSGLVLVLVAQLCPTIWDPTDHSLPGSSIYGILQTRRLEWVTIPFSRASSWPKDQTWVSCIAKDFFFTIWATRENSGYETTKDSGSWEKEINQQCAFNWSYMI